jgi:hypothetical protein
MALLRKRGVRKKIKEAANRMKEKERDGMLGAWKRGRIPSGPFCRGWA